MIVEGLQNLQQEKQFEFAAKSIDRFRDVLLDFEEGIEGLVKSEPKVSRKS